MLLSERIKALAPSDATYYRLVMQLHDGRTRLYPTESPGYFVVGESPYGVPSGYYAVSFFTAHHRPIPHSGQTIQIDLQSEVHRANQSQLSLHQAGRRPLLGSGSSPSAPLNASGSMPPPSTLATSAPSSSESDSEGPSDLAEDAGLEFRKYTYAMDLEDRQQEFIKNSSYVTEVGEVFGLNRIMRRELMELQRMLVVNAQHAHKEVTQVKGTVHDLLQLQREVLANAAENIARPAPTPPDYVGLGHAALATLRDIGVALIGRSESRSSAPTMQRVGESPQLSPPPAAPSEVPDSSSAPKVPAAPDAIDKMVSRLRETTDYEVALAVSSPSQWKAFLEGLRPDGQAPAGKSSEPGQGNETTGPKKESAK